MITLGLLVILGSVPGRAHDLGGSPTDVIVSFPLVLGMSAGIGAVGGFVTVLYHPRENSRGGLGHRLTGLLGFALIGLGVIAFVPVATSWPGIAIVGVLTGSVIGLRLPDHEVDAHGSIVATTAFGALTLHRTVEGVALATVYATGSALGVIAAIVLTAHTLLETAVVGTLYGEVNQRYRGISAVLTLQAIFVLTALLALSTTISLPANTRGFIVATVAGILLVIGGHECRERVTGFGT